jgi:hypothetical protein
LVVNGQARLETLDEHVFQNGVALKDRYVCSNSSCLSHSVGACWNYEGDFYRDLYAKDMPFIDGLYSAFGSIARQQEASEKKSREKDHIFLTFPCWPRKGWTLWRRATVTANEDGEVVKIRWRFEWVTDEHIVHVGGLQMLKHFFRQLKNRRGSDYWYFEYLQDSVKRSKWPDAEWWRKVEGFIARFLLKINSVQLEKENEKESNC